MWSFSYYNIPYAYRNSNKSMAGIYKRKMTEECRKCGSRLGVETQTLCFPCYEREWNKIENEKS